MLMPSAAAGYSITSAEQYVAIGFTGRLSSDPLGLMTQGETVVQQGLGAQIGVSRWGDYASMSIDPSDGEWVHPSRGERPNGCRCASYAPVHLLVHDGVPWQHWLGALAHEDRVVQRKCCGVTRVGGRQKLSLG